MRIGGPPQAWWFRAPRWLAPAVGAAVLVLVFLALPLGASVLAVFGSMAALVLVGLLLSLLLADPERDDRRGDLPISMGIIWIVLAFAAGGVLLPMIAVLCWPAYIVGAAYAISKAVSLGWIAAGFICVLAINLLIFGVFWHP